MTFKKFISTLIQEYKSYKEQAQKEEKDKLEAERLKLEALQKVSFINDKIVNSQTIQLIERVFKIYPTSQINKVEFISGDPKNWRLLVYDPDEETIKIDLKTLVPPCPHKSHDDNIDYNHQNIKLSVRGKIYNELLRSLIEFIFEAKNPKNIIDLESEKEVLSKQLTREFATTIIPGFRKLDKSPGELNFDGKWVCHSCAEYYNFVLNQAESHNLDDEYPLKDGDEPAYREKDGGLYCSQCYERQKEFAIKEMVEDEMKLRFHHDEKSHNMHKNQISEEILLAIFSGDNVIEPPLIINEPYLAPLVFEELNKGVENKLTWATERLNWPDTAVVFEYSSVHVTKGTQENLKNIHAIYYSMADYYHYFFKKPKPRLILIEPLNEHELMEIEKQSRELFHTDEYCQSIERFKEQMIKLKNYIPPEKEDPLRYINHCWNCGDIIDSKYCDSVPGYGYKCNKCGCSLKGYYGF